MRFLCLPQVFRGMLQLCFAESLQKCFVDYKTSSTGYRRRAGEKTMTFFSYCGVNCSFKMQWPWRREWNAAFTPLTFRAALIRDLLRLGVTCSISSTHHWVLSMNLMLLSANPTHPQCSLRRAKPSVLTSGSAITDRKYWITKATTIRLRFKRSSGSLIVKSGFVVL